MFSSPFGRKTKIKDFAARLGSIVDKILPSPFTKFLTRQTSLADFKRITIPLVRRIYPQLISEKIVSVQPMTEPSGLNFYLNYKYSQTKD
jgi:hypothetical protein